MEFRWLVFLTLWTALSGPVLSQPATAARRPAPIHVDPDIPLAPPPR